jgi:23S rRNA maturation mini-RNase III
MASAGEAAAVGPSAAAFTGPVLLQVPLLAHTLQLYQKTWPSLSRLLCGQLTTEEQAAMAGTWEVWKHHQKLQIVRRRLCSTSSTTVSCCWQPDGQPQQNAAAVAAAAGLVLLGNNSILLQQLLRTASAAAESQQQQQQPQQQQQQLVSAVLYCADCLGDQVGGLWADVLFSGSRAA